MRGLGFEGFLERQAPNVFQAVADDSVGAVLDPLGGVGIGGATVRGVIFKAAVLGRVV